MEVDLLPIPR